MPDQNQFRFDLVLFVVLPFCTSSNGYAAVSVSSSTFQEILSDGHLKLLGSYQHVRSTLYCAQACHGRRRSDPSCEGFSINSTSCHLYTGRIFETIYSSLGLKVFRLLRNNTVDVPITTTLPFVDIIWPPESNITYNYIAAGRKPYTEARDVCVEAGGYLLHLDSLEELDAVRSFRLTLGWITYDNVWVGANDIAKDGQWVCEKHGTPLNSVWPWADGLGNESCAVLHFHDWLLHDRQCDAWNYYICERDSWI